MTLDKWKEKGIDDADTCNCPGCSVSPDRSFRMNIVNKVPPLTNTTNTKMKRGFLLPDKSKTKEKPPETPPPTPNRQPSVPTAPQTRESTPQPKPKPAPEKMPETIECQTVMYNEVIHTEEKKELKCRGCSETMDEMQITVYQVICDEGCNALFHKQCMEKVMGVTVKKNFKTSCCPYHSDRPVTINNRESGRSSEFVLWVRNDAKEMDKGGKQQGKKEKEVMTKEEKKKMKMKKGGDRQEDEEEEETPSPQEVTPPVEERIPVVEEKMRISLALPTRIVDEEPRETREAKQFVKPLPADLDARPLERKEDAVMSKYAVKETTKEGKKKNKKEVRQVILAGMTVKGQKGRVEDDDDGWDRKSDDGIGGEDREENINDTPPIAFDIGRFDYNTPPPPSESFSYLHPPPPSFMGEQAPPPSIYPHMFTAPGMQPMYMQQNGYNGFTPNQGSFPYQGVPYGGNGGGGVFRPSNGPEFSNQFRPSQSEGRGGTTVSESIESHSEDMPPVIEDETSFPDLVQDGVHARKKLLHFYEAEIGSLKENASIEKGAMSMQTLHGLLEGFLEAYSALGEEENGRLKETLDGTFNDENALIEFISDLGIFKCSRVNGEIQVMILDDSERRRAEDARNQRKAEEKKRRMEEERRKKEEEDKKREIERKEKEEKMKIEKARKDEEERKKKEIEDERRRKEEEKRLAEEMKKKAEEEERRKKEDERRLIEEDKKKKEELGRKMVEEEEKRQKKYEAKMKEEKEKKDKEEADRKKKKEEEDRQRRMNEMMMEEEKRKEREKMSEKERMEDQKKRLEEKKKREEDERMRKIEECMREKDEQEKKENGAKPEEKTKGAERKARKAMKTLQQHDTDESSPERKDSLLPSTTFSTAAPPFVPRSLPPPLLPSATAELNPNAAEFVPVNRLDEEEDGDYAYLLRDGNGELVDDKWIEDNAAKMEMQEEKMREMAEYVELLEMEKEKMKKENEEREREMLMKEGEKRRMNETINEITAKLDGVRREKEEMDRRASDRNIKAENEKGALRAEMYGRMEEKERELELMKDRVRREIGETDQIRRRMERMKMEEKRRMLEKKEKASRDAIVYLNGIINVLVEVPDGLTLTSHMVDLRMKWTIYRSILVKSLERLYRGEEVELDVLLEFPPSFPLETRDFVKECYVHTYRKMHELATRLAFEVQKYLKMAGREHPDCHVFGVIIKWMRTVADPSSCDTTVPQAANMVAQALRGAPLMPQKLKTIASLSDSTSSLPSTSSRPPPPSIPHLNTGRDLPSSSSRSAPPPSNTPMMWKIPSDSKRVVDLIDHECCICFYKIREDDVLYCEVSSCSEPYHKQCLELYWNSKLQKGTSLCPKCRQAMPHRDVFPAL